MNIAKTDIFLQMIAAAKKFIPNENPQKDEILKSIAIDNCNYSQSEINNCITIDLNNSGIHCSVHTIPNFNCFAFYFWKIEDDLTKIPSVSIVETFNPFVCENECLTEYAIVSFDNGQNYYRCEIDENGFPVNDPSEYDATPVDVSTLNEDVIIFDGPILTDEEQAQLEELLATRGSPDVEESIFSDADWEEIEEILSTCSGPDIEVPLFTPEEWEEFDKILSECDPAPDGDIYDDYAWREDVDEAE